MNLKLSHIGISLLISVFTVQSQNTYEIDTSYTINSAYKKYLKQYPDIEIVKPRGFENVIEEADIAYKDLGYRKLHLDAYYNSNKKLKPAIILIHGGGWKSGNKSLMEPMAQHMASKGYACFTVEYRLSLEAKFPSGIFDVKTAIQYVKSNADRFFVDTMKVAVLGCSAGGQMAALIGTTNNNEDFEDAASIYKNSSTVHAIIDVDGILAFKHPKSEEGKVASLWLGGNSEENLETWINASALTHTDQNTPPILFIGSKYDRFQAGREDMIKILNQYNIYNQVENFTNAPHSFWLFHPWFEDTTEYVIKFLDKTFKKI
ncbi:MAG TPA: alpha/beta hydrolase [Flavobacteriaceae bacterium]